MSWLQSPCTKVLLWTVFNVTESDIVAGYFVCLFVCLGKDLTIRFRDAGQLLTGSNANSPYLVLG